MLGPSMELHGLVRYNLVLMLACEMKIEKSYNFYRLLTPLLPICR